MDEVSIEKARARLGDLVHDAQDGTATRITRSGKPAAMIAPLPRLTEYDRRTIAEARKLAAISGAAAVRELTGDDDGAMAYAVLAGRLQFHVRDLLGIVARLTGEDGAQ